MRTLYARTFYVLILLSGLALQQSAAHAEDSLEQQVHELQDQTQLNYFMLLADHGRQQQMSRAQEIAKCRANCRTYFPEPFQHKLLLECYQTVREEAAK
jgi:hypothetical protein